MRMHSGLYLTVPGTGLEPARISPPVPKTGMATNYITRAYVGVSVRISRLPRRGALLRLSPR
jgi:hypothetical protein